MREVHAGLKQAFAKTLYGQKIRGGQADELLANSMPIALVLASAKHFYGADINKNTLAPLEGFRVIEIGFGPEPHGMVFPALKLFGASGVGAVDADPIAVEKAKALMKSLPAKSLRRDARNVLHGNAEDLGRLFPRKTRAHMVISSGVLANAPLGKFSQADAERKMSEILTEARKHLAPGDLTIHTISEPFVLSHGDVEKLGFKVFEIGEVPDFAFPGHKGPHARTIIILQKKARAR